MNSEPVIELAPAATFAALVEARRNRRDEWYKVPAGCIDVCNVPIPARVR